MAAARNSSLAALIVSIVITYLVRTGRSEQVGRVWIGTGLAAVLSLIVGVAIARQNTGDILVRLKPRGCASVGVWPRILTLVRMSMFFFLKLRTTTLATSLSMRPCALTCAKSRTRRSSRPAIRGVPRERLAISAAAASSVGMTRMRAERRTISTMSVSL